MANKKEKREYLGKVLTDTEYMYAYEIETNFKGKRFSVREVVESLIAQGKDTNLKQGTATVARLNTTHGLYKKHEPEKVVTYEIEEIENVESE